MKKNSHQALAVKLLRDAATFFTTLGNQNSDLFEKMTENAQVFRQVSDLLEQDLESRLGDRRATELAGNLLHDAAKFFDSLAEKNPTLREQMHENANVYNQLGDLIASAPHGILEDNNRTLQEGDRKDPVLFASARTDFPCIDAALEIGISVPCKGCPNPTLTVGSTTDNVLHHARTAVLKRDAYTCAYCGFQSAKYQQVIAPNGGFAPSQMLCACIFCAQVGMLDIAALQRSAVLIWLPEMSQAQLNSWMRAIYIARISQGHAAEKARAVLNALLGRRTEAQARIGTDDPKVLAKELMAIPDTQAYCRRIESLSDIRVMPLDRRIVREQDLEFNQFPQILAFWRSKDGPYGGLAPNSMDFSDLDKLMMVMKERQAT